MFIIRGKEMRKLSNGISNYEDIVREDRLYVDKTMYIEKIENLSDKTIMFLRPRKFGKTLFTSTLECYYDINKKDKFEELFRNTYIGKNPTENRNKYCILRFNFSGISTENIEETIKGFKNSTIESIKLFIAKYNLDFYINENQEAEEILNSLYTAFQIQKANEKIYVIIDEYDHFANELLGFRTDEFKNLIAKNGKIRKWYEILKKGTETVIDRIFITGVSPVTLDSTTSGFNIANDITKNILFNDMLGFSKDDVIYLMNELEIPKEKQKELLPIMKTNYDGYIFSNMIRENLENYKMYNSNMTLYFLEAYKQQNEIPKELVDLNIISDYGKIEAFMDLCQNMNKIDILEKIVAGDLIESSLTEKFNAEIQFGEKELISLLFYLGYLTIKEIGFSKYKFQIPNDVIKEIYSNYFLEYISRKANIVIDSIDTEKVNKELLLEWKIDKLLDVLKEFLTNLSNRDYQRFDEKYVKIIFYSICRMLGTLYVKSELELSGQYADILLVPKEKLKERYSILIEFKYIKQEDYDKDNSLLKNKQKQARIQLETYKRSEEITMLPKLKSYSIVVIKDKIFIEEV
mgnify:FL=1